MTTSAPVSSFDPTALRALQGLDFRARYLVEGYLAGLHQSPFHGSSVEFSEYRDYQPGDDWRKLDWRLYARGDRLYMKKYEQETEARCFLIMDRSASMNYQGSRSWASKSSTAATLAAAMSWFLLRQKDPVGLLGFRTEANDQRALHYLAPSQRPNRLGELLRGLEALPVAGGAQLPELLDHALRLIRRRSILLIFSDLLEPLENLETRLKHLRFRGHEVLVFQTLDADELDFPFSEQSVFADPETGVRRQVQPAEARRNYLARFEAFRASQTEMLRKLEVSHQLFRSDENPGPALARFLGHRRQYSRR
jgi:uncharacterized protein (DUF58 family)